MIPVLTPKESKLLVESIGADPKTGIHISPVPKYLTRLIELGYIKYAPTKMSDYRTKIVATKTGRMRILDPDMLYVTEVMEG